MKLSPFNEEQQDWIRENYKYNKAENIAKEFGVKRYQIYNFIMKEKLGKKKKRERLKKTDNGMFDISLRFNWVA